MSAGELDSVLSSEALLCALQRVDGVGLSVTSHDRTIHRAGVGYEPSPGLGSAVISLADDLQDCSLELRGAIVSNVMRREDLVAGRWSEATILLGTGDWQSDESLHVVGMGCLRTIVQEKEQLAGKVDLAPARLRAQPCPLTSPECRAQLGDRLCRVNMRARTARAKVLSSEGLVLTLSLEELGKFKLGWARWVSGANSGFDQAIIDTSASQIVLREPAPHPVSTGDVVLLREGCDGRLETCRDRFQNVSNFRGEPHLPGTDFVTRYPGG